MLESNKNSKNKPFLVALSFAFISIIFACDLNQTEEVILKQENEPASNEKGLENEDIDESKVFSIVEKQAEPRGGIQAFYDAIKEDMIGNYPQEAINKGIQGIVSCNL